MADMVRLKWFGHLVWSIKVRMIMELVEVIDRERVRKTQGVYSKQDWDLLGLKQEWTRLCGNVEELNIWAK